MQGRVEGLEVVVVEVEDDADDLVEERDRAEVRWDGPAVRRSGVAADGL